MLSTGFTLQRSSSSIDASPLLTSLQLESILLSPNVQRSFAASSTQLWSSQETESEYSEYSDTNSLGSPVFSSTSLSSSDSPLSTTSTSSLPSAPSSWSIWQLSFTHRFAGFLSLLRSNRMYVLLSFISFHHFAVCSYCILALHFILLYLTSFFLFLHFENDLAYSEPGSLIYRILSFLFVFRSVVEIVMVFWRMQHSDLWWNRISTGGKRYGAVQKMQCVLSISILTLSVLAYTIISPPTSSNSIFVQTPFLLCFIIRDVLALLLPFVAWLLLNKFGGFSFQSMTYSIPYVYIDPDDFTMIGLATKKEEGMSESEVNALPVSKIKVSQEESHEDLTCAICLIDLQAGDEIRTLHCSHLFHRQCIDRWLLKKPTCALCVQSVTMAAPRLDSQPSPLTLQHIPPLEI